MWRNHKLEALAPTHLPPPRSPSAVFVVGEGEGTADPSVG